MVNTLLTLYETYKRLLSCIVQPTLLLVARLYMANIFFKSGLVKISSWQSTTYLFKNVYKVPFLDPILAAYMATTIELTVPIFLVFGFVTRVAVIPLLIMTLTIQFTFMNLDIHYLWMIVLSTLMVFGSGKFSTDALFYKLYQRKILKHGDCS